MKLGWIVGCARFFVQLDSQKFYNPYLTGKLFPFVLIAETLTFFQASAYEKRASPNAYLGKFLLRRNYLRTPLR